MQVAKYWRKNQLRYRLEGLTQNKLERNVKVDTLKISDVAEINIKATKIKSNVA